MNISSLDFGYLRKLVRQHSAIVLNADKEYLAELHLGKLALSAGFDSISSLVAYLQTQPFGDLHFRAIESLVTTETSFFRDIYPFEALKNFVLPELIDRRKNERSLNIWSAACSSGQEPYSIAMLVREQFPTLLNWNLRLIASDFSGQILARARQGRYTQLEINRGLPENLRDRYFQQQDNQWQIVPNIRQMVEFRQINLIDSWSSLLPMDIIFLRNVLIYFDTETKKTILAKVRRVLKPDGYLFLGGGETTLNLDDAFKRVHIEKSVCHRLI
ncbi:MAG: protein-glutamate O-methyltransferase CheR [Hydrococcus sp. Prado102]|jgi:chemotaxis protein methyltransferase CheR|nr:protein-glutamate O-methyltransferase CheR [Hydrococcus sp. Prado102]